MSAKIGCGGHASEQCNLKKCGVEVPQPAPCMKTPRKEGEISLPPQVYSIRSRPGWVEPEIHFRLVLVAQVVHQDAPVAAYREQTAEFVSWANGKFRGNPSPGASEVVHFGRKEETPMPARNPRVNVVLEKPLYEAVDQLAKEEGVSLSTVVRDLVKEAIEIREDIDLGRIAESREKSLKRSRALAHKDVWG